MATKRRNEYSMILLCTTSTIENVKSYYEYFQIYIQPKEIIVIGNEKVKNIIEEECLQVKFLDEDKLYPGLNFQKVKKSILGRTADEIAANRTGWYFQQFLKMAYCMYTEDENYLVWDADTVPTHKVEMQTISGKNFFDVKTEYHRPYFDTLEKLFPDLKKNNNYSYISEHMIFKTQVMREIIERIEKNQDIVGKSFWEKILSAVSEQELAGSGFSEFETYGTYVQYYHPESYEIREWKSLREGTIFYGKELNRQQLSYLSRKYDAVSFERHSIHEKLSKIFAHKIFRNFVSFGILEQIKNLSRKFSDGEK